MQVGIHLNKAPALAEAEGFRADMKRLNAGLLADSQAAAARETEVAKKSRDDRGRFIAGAKADAVSAYRAIGDAAVQAGDKAAKAGAEGASAFRGMGEAGVGGLGSIVSSFGPVMAGITSAISLTKVWGDALDEIGKKQDARAKAVNAEFNKDRRVGALEGKPVDAKFVVEQARASKRTMLNADELRTAKEAFQGAGAQHIGEGPGKLAPELGRRAFEETAKLGVSQGYDASVVAEMTGRAVGRHKTEGAAAPEAVKRDVNAAMSVLASGQGDESKLAVSANKLDAALAGEDSTKGVFQKNSDVAVLTSTLAEGFGEEEVTSAGQSLVKGLRGTGKDDKQAELLKRAGITLKDNPIQALKKLAPVLEKEAKDKGVSIQDVAKEHFADELQQRSVAVGVKGVQTGVVAAREKTAEEASAPGAADEKVRKFRTTQAGVQRQNEADRALVEAEKGEKTSKLAQVEEQANTDLEKSGVTQTPAAKALAGFIKSATFGAVDPEAAVRDNRMKKRLLARMTPALQKKYADAEVPTDPRARADFFNRMIRDIEATGRSAISDVAIDPNSEEAADLREGALGGPAKNGMDFRARKNVPAVAGVAGPGAVGGVGVAGVGAGEPMDPAEQKAAGEPKGQGIDDTGIKRLLAQIRDAIVAPQGAPAPMLGRPFNQGR